MYPFITAIWVEVQFSGFWEHALYPGLWLHTEQESERDRGYACARVVSTSAIDERTKKKKKNKKKEHTQRESTNTAEQFPFSPPTCLGKLFTGSAVKMHHVCHMSSAFMVRRNRQYLKVSASETKERRARTAGGCP
jgi:hypothetical protein